jgi:hypothetical protein
MLERLGFAEQWIHWMMLCVSSVNYSILVNCEKVGPIILGRGVRQGDRSSFSLPLYFSGRRAINTYKKFQGHGVTSMVSKYVEGHVWCPRYFLLMIVSYFAGQI